VWYLDISHNDLFFDSLSAPPVDLHQLTPESSKLGGFWQYIAGRSLPFVFMKLVKTGF
jgi:hypothetical protein